MWWGLGYSRVNLKVGVLTIYYRFHAWQSSMLFATMFVSISIFPNVTYAHMPKIDHPPTVLLVELSLLDIVHYRYRINRLPQHACLPRWWVFRGFLHRSCSLAGKMDLVLTTLSPVDTLDHFEVPFFGHLANSFVDDEWAWTICLSLRIARTWIITARKHVFSSYTPVCQYLLVSFF